MKPSKRNAAVSKSNFNPKLKPNISELKRIVDARLKPILSGVLRRFDSKLRSGDGEYFYGSVLKCKNRGTSVCTNCKAMARLLGHHARISTHFYCTVPRCGEVEIHRMKEEDLVTGLRDEMQRMSITGDVVKPEAVKVHRVKEEDDLTGLRDEMQLMTKTGDDGVAPKLSNANNVDPRGRMITRARAKTMRKAGMRPIFVQLKAPVQDRVKEQELREEMQRMTITGDVTD